MYMEWCNHTLIINEKGEHILWAKMKKTLGTDVHSILVYELVLCHSIFLWNHVINILLHVLQCIMSHKQTVATFENGMFPYISISAMPW